MKGGDKAEIRLKTRNDEEGTTQTYADLDELKHWADSRYISAHEACWRILEFPTNALSHVVCRLSIHLPGEHNVVFTEENIESAADGDLGETTLTQYFALNKGSTYTKEDQELASQTLYHDIPRYFLWDTATKSWICRPRKCPTLPGMHWNTHKPL